MEWAQLKDWVEDKYQLSKNQITELYEKTVEYKSQVNSWKKNEERDKNRGIDNFLFTPDELPTLGKEYWFFLFTGLGDNHKDQLMISFGRNSNNSMRIDEILQYQTTDEYIGAIGEVWYYFNGDTIKFGKMGGKVVSTENAITFETNNYKVKFSGEFPVYNIEVWKSKEKEIEIKTSMPKIGDAREFFYIDKANFGVEVGNVYLDFIGTIEERNFNGRTYMQKVVMSAPFLPWYWGRFVFENGSVLVFFLLWIEGPGFERVIYKSAKYFDLESEKYIVFKDFDIQFFVGTNYWLLTHDSDDLNVFLLMESYANNEFVLKARGEFNYNEMFTEIREIKIKNKDKTYGSEYFGRGNGSLEDAKGICF